MRAENLPVQSIQKAFDGLEGCRISFRIRIDGSKLNYYTTNYNNIEVPPNNPTHNQHRMLVSEIQ